MNSLTIDSHNGPAILRDEGLPSPKWCRKDVNTSEVAFKRNKRVKRVSSIFEEISSVIASDLEKAYTSLELRVPQEFSGVEEAVAYANIEFSGGPDKNIKDRHSCPHKGAESASPEGRQWECLPQEPISGPLFCS